MKGLHMVAWILVIIGGLNWGLTALGWNAVHAIFGFSSTLEKLIYLLVGLSAIYEIFTHKKNCKMCSAGKDDMKPMAGGMGQM